MPPTPPPQKPQGPRGPQGPRRVPQSVAIEQIKSHLRARRKGKKANIRVAALNITSFLDMSFCLLMFLTLSAGGPGIKEGVFTSNLSKVGGEGGASTEEVPTIKRPINLVVSSRGENQYVIEIDATSSSTTGFDTLYRTLKDLNASTNQQGIYEDDSPVIIRPRGDVPWYGVVSAFNAAVRARFKNVGFARVGG